MVYPLAVTAPPVAVSQTRGQRIHRRRSMDVKAVGSSLIGQHSRRRGISGSRPSATGPMPYNGAASGGSNLGPLNPALLRCGRRASRRSGPPIRQHATGAGRSGDRIRQRPRSGHQLAAAFYQSARVARARGNRYHRRADQLIEQLAQRPWLGIVGEPRVNVVALNRALDAER
jgi:K+-transporting ATPase ATPase C chain